VLEIVELLDGPLGRGTPTGVFADAAEAARSVLAQTTIADVIEREAREAGARMYYIYQPVSRLDTDRLGRCARDGGAHAAHGVEGARDISTMPTIVLYNGDEYVVSESIEDILASTFNSLDGLVHVTSATDGQATDGQPLAIRAADIARLTVRSTRAEIKSHHDDPSF
jgi:hypothetical protein